MIGRSFRRPGVEFLLQLIDTLLHGFQLLGHCGGNRRVGGIGLRIAADGPLDSCARAISGSMALAISKIAAVRPCSRDKARHLLFQMNEETPSCGRVNGLRFR